MALTDQAWVSRDLCSWAGISQTDPREKEESSKDSGGKERACVRWFCETGAKIARAAPEGEGLALAQGSRGSP